MNKNPILIVEDDEDDSALLVNALTKLGVTNKLMCFDSPISALKYLHSTNEKTFMIISDINMPMMDGLEFKRFINNDLFLHAKDIPFIFLTTSADNNIVKQASHLSIQGYFQKPGNLNSMGEIAKAIFGYWNQSIFSNPVS